MATDKGRWAREGRGALLSSGTAWRTLALVAVAAADTLRGSEAVFFLTNLGMILFSGFLDWKALITGHPPPEWMFHPRPERR